MEIKRGLCTVSPTKIYRQSVMCCLQGVSGVSQNISINAIMNSFFREKDL